MEGFFPCRRTLASGREEFRLGSMTSALAMAARAELENEAFQAAIIRLEEKWLDHIRYSNGDEVERREYAYRMLKVLADFVDELRAMTAIIAHERGRAATQQMMK